LDRREETLTVEVEDDLVEEAGVLVEKHRLRALDALHLAAALSLGDPALVFATWDSELATAVRNVGLAVASS
jgi:predicted nucleic acid-binding protein